MDFDDGVQGMVTIDRDEAEGLTQPEIIERLIILAETDEDGFFVPMDFNYAGIPNIYLRGRFGFDLDKGETVRDGKHIEDLFVMFVERKTNESRSSS